MFAIKPEPNKETSPLIMCAGCSFTSGTRTMSGYPVELAKLLPKNRIWNLGVSGCGTWAQYYFADYVSELNPSLIIFQMMGPNRNPLTEEELEFLSIFDEESSSFRDLTIKVREVRRQMLYRWNKDRPLYNSEDEELWETCISSDLSWVRKVREKYSCPFIFLLNSKEYPYRSAKRSKAVASRLKMISDSEVLQTHFSGPLFKIGDGHPNKRRNQSTATLLFDMIRKNYSNVVSI